MGDTQTMDFSMNIGWPDTGACVSDRRRCYMLVKVGERGVSAGYVHRWYRALGVDMWVWFVRLCVCAVMDECMGGYVIGCGGNWILRRGRHVPSRLNLGER